MAIKELHNEIKEDEQLGISDPLNTSQDATLAQTEMPSGSFSNISSGEEIIQNGMLRSGNFVAATTGWQIKADGDVEFNSGTFRSQLIAGSIDIPDTTTANSFHVDSNGNAWWGAALLANSVAEVLNTGAAKFTSGTIGGWTLADTTLSSTNIVIDNANEQITVGTGSNQITIAGSTGAISSNNSAWVLNGDGTIIIGSSLTASGSIAKDDMVYVSASGTVKTLYPSALETGTTIATAPAGTPSTFKKIKLSTSGRYLNLGGGNVDVQNNLTGEVRTLNAAETDFTNGGSTNIYTTGLGVRFFDVCEIDTDKFLIIFQATAAGPVADGIKSVVISISGTTITVGAVVTVETTGNLQSRPYIACAKVDTDKACIYYPADADSDLYVKVLTVSGTTITQNAAVSVLVGSDQGCAAAQLATNENIVCYDGTGNNIGGKTISISGTTPTVNAEQTIYSGATTSYYLTLKRISSTKSYLNFAGTGATPNSSAVILTSSGATITAGVVTGMDGTRATNYFGTEILSNKYLITFIRLTNTSFKLFLYDVSGTNISELNTQSFTFQDTTYKETSVAEVAPWIIVIQGGESAVNDRLVKLTPVSTRRVGIAKAAITDANAGTILNRYQVHIVSGFTAVSTYVVNHDGQPTTRTSTVAPDYGIAISATQLLLQ